MNVAIIRTLGIIVFLYLLWRNLRENYKEESLISYSWIALLSFFVGGRVFYGLINWGIWNDSWINWFSVWNKSGTSLIGGLLTVFGITYIICKKEGWKLWSFAEDSLNIFLIFLGFLLLDEFVRSGLNIRVGIDFILVVVGFIVLELIN
jgi:prolipoprotein diacylglyceryltransferase